MQDNTTESKQKPGNIREFDFLYRIAEHVAKGDTFDETLASAIDFVVSLVGSDECIAYVRDGIQLVPWVWKYSNARSVAQPKFSLVHVYARALSEHLQPIAVSQGADTAPQVRHFPAWSIDPGETSIWIPLVARSVLVGALHLEHRHPRSYDRREINLLSSMGHMLGVDIRISQLKNENCDLVLELETRKLVERGKGILQRDLGLSEHEAYLALQRQSREKRRPMKELAEAIILSDEVKRSFATN
jgi:GAF domain-containing protein